jgi:phage tail sheath protein FI
MPEYLAPGTYVEEVRGGVVPIQGVSTSTAGFVGRTERGPDAPLLVTSWPEYARWFGGYLEPTTSFLPFAVQGFFANGGQRVFVARVSGGGAARAQATLASTEPAQSLTVRAIGSGAWGSAVTVKVLPSGKQRPDRFRLVVNYPASVPGGPPVTEDYDDLGVEPSAPRYVLGVVNTASHLIGLSWTDPTSPLHPLPTVGGDAVTLVGGSDGAAPVAEDYIGHPEAAPDDKRGLAALEAIDQISILAVPDAVGFLAATADGQAVTEAVLEQCESLRDRMAILDVGQGQGDVNTIATNYLGRRSDYAAIYYPFIRVLDPRTSQPVLVPPSGHVAGIYAFNDVTRGVHKAPANYEVRGILSRNVTATEGPLEYLITKGQQDLLNPLGVNVLRDFRASGQGVRVWGARTISADPGWIYVNVRRLFLFVEESIDEALQWVVFEPNDEPTWARVRQSISIFLERVWRDGGLMGSTPEQAFFVRCDRTTMSADDILNGRLICLVGLAPVRPAEFVVLRFSQMTIESTT